MVLGPARVTSIFLLKVGTHTVDLGVEVVDEVEDYRFQRLRSLWRTILVLAVMGEESYNFV